MSNSETRQAVIRKHKVTRGKSYLFDVGTAVEYGLSAAVIIRNFQFWIERNHANGKHRHDDRTWTYCSVAALTDLFPFFTTRQIRTILDNLIRRKVLVKGRYNPKGYDRTTWYAFGDEKAFVNFDKSIGQKGQIQSSPATNPSAEFDEPIPDKKHISKTDDKGILSPFLLSSKIRRNQVAVDSEILKAWQLLIFHHVKEDVATRIVYEQRVPPESIFNVCKNGLVREQNSKAKGGKWKLRPGYIVAAIKKARQEGKIIQPTKASKLRDKYEAAKKESSTPLTPAEFEKRRQKQQGDLRKRKTI